MRKLIFNLLFLSNAFAIAQSINDTIVVRMDTPAFKQVVLYAAEGAQQKYITHSNSEDGVFKMAIPKNAPHAAYRLVFDQETMDFLDFLYVGKSFEVHFNPTDLKQFPTFVNSEENTRYFDFLFKINGIQQQMDSLQVEVFKNQDNNVLKNLKSQYSFKNEQLNKILATIDNNTENQLIKDILRANVRVLPSQLIVDPAQYLPFIKQHFFDHIDFNNPNLVHSSILVDKVMDYVFYLTVAEDTKTQNEIYIRAASDVLNKISDDSLKKGFIQALIQSFSQDENVYVIDELFNNYYDTLPSDLQNKNWAEAVKKELNTAITRQAPDFNFMFKNQNLKLYDLKGYKYYIVVFWSTTCSHCLKEVPMFYDYIKDRTDTKVIAIGLETYDSRFTWEDEVADYTAFINVLGLGKWENEIARGYNVHATPTYFILDENKVIIEKPYDFEALEQFYEEHIKR